MNQRGDTFPDTGFTITDVRSLGEIPRGVLDDLVITYQSSFSGEPYGEVWKQSDVERTLAEFLGKKGHLLVGKDNGRAIGLAAGYPRGNAYYIAELAVSPQSQGRGFGKQLLMELLVVAGPIANGRFEIRTNAENDRALHMYEAEGFVRQPILEVVPHKRVDGKIRLDKRITLSRPAATDRELMSSLHRVVVAYPSGNTTALVFDDCLDRDRESFNSELMATWQQISPEKPEIEQCGFITQPINDGSVARLEMMGGEFCGNALRCAAWLVTDGKDFAGFMEASGVTRPLAFEVNDGIVSVEMPVLAIEDSLDGIATQGRVVRFEGFTHFVVESSKLDVTPRELLETILLENVGGLAMTPAVGVTSYDSSTREAQFAVWVKKVDSFFDETACGSGTSAIAVVLATESGETVDIGVRQPSGEVIQSKAVIDGGGLSSSWISGPVSVLYDKEFNLNVR